MIPRVIRFLTVDIWRIRLRNLPRRHSFLIKQLRVVLLALRGFYEDRCQLRASALTFYSLLSLVPVLAMAFGIAKGFGLEKTLNEQLAALSTKFPGQAEMFTDFIGYADRLLENTRGGAVAGVGVAVLFWTVIKMLGNIEKSFNSIWGVKKSRSIARKLSDYLSIMLICPILFVVSSSATVFVAGRIEVLVEKVSLLGAISPLIFAILKLFPYCIVWVLFSFIYIFMPNAKINFKSGLLAGIVAGTIYQVVQWAYVTFQIGVAKYNAIYATFAALPLFLLWIQISWLVVLFGAEISFAHQNVDTYEFEPDCLRASNRFRKLLALRMTHQLVKNFCAGEEPWTATQISHNLEIPIRLVRQLLFELTEARILSETVTEENEEGAYQPAQSPEKYTPKYVLEALDRRGSDDIPVADSSELDILSQCLDDFAAVIEKSPANILLKEL
jgi:membrane protein